MMSDGPTPPKGVAKVEQTQQTLAEKEVAAVEQESQSLSEKPVKENESVVTSEQLPMGLDVLQNKKSVEDADDPGPPLAVSTIESPVQLESPALARSFFLHKREQRYDVDKGYGLVAIINNFTDEKKDGNKYREGTVEDEKRIRKFFENGKFKGKYKVEARQNLDEILFITFLKELTSLLDDPKEEIHSFFLFIMSHGNETGVETYFEDNGAVLHVPIDSITERFKPSLPDLPKVVVVQACRGSDVNKGLKVPPTAQPAEDESPPSALQVTVPDASDMLIVLATIKGCVAYRDIDGTGSYLLVNLFRQLNEAHDEKYYSSHLMELVTETLSQVADEEMRDGRKVRKQMPCFESTLRKRFYLLPPVLPQ